MIPFFGFLAFVAIICFSKISDALTVEKKITSALDLPLKYEKICQVHAPKNHNSDSSPDIFEAVTRCVGGGAVILESGIEYVLRSKLDLINLENVDIYIAGSLVLSDDIDYWQENLIFYEYQNSSTAIRIGGKNVNVYGLEGHVIDGRGQAWWNKFANKKNQDFYRPILLVFDNLRDSVIDGLNLINSPMWFNLIANSSGVLYSNTKITAETTNEFNYYNSDGWDAYRTSNLVIENATVYNGDDCFSFKPNTTNVILKNLYCNGSHGISIGSIGQYYGVTDIVEDVLITNVTMENSDYGARIKTWSDRENGSNKTDAGGGLGRVRNIFFNDFKINNCGQAIYLTQCYGSTSIDTCYKYPSFLTIENVGFINFSGKTSGKYNESGTLICSSDKVCSDLYAKKVDVLNPKTNSSFYLTSNLGDSHIFANLINSTAQVGANNGL